MNLPGQKACSNSVQKWRFSCFIFNLHPLINDRGGGYSSQGNCGACGKDIKGQAINAFKKVFHANCFACSGCGEKFAQTGNREVSGTLVFVCNHIAATSQSGRKSKIIKKGFVRKCSQPPKKTFFNYFPNLTGACNDGIYFLITSL